MKTKLIHFAFILLLIAALIPLAACNKSAANNQAKDKEEKPAIPVEIATVQKGTVSASYTGTTTLEAEGEAVVVAKVSGVIKKLYVEEGQQVKAGQVLAKLEDEQYIYELDQAKAKLEKLANEYKRNEELYRSKIVGLEAYERVKSEYETQKSICDLAQLNLAHTEVKAPISGVISERMVKTGNMVTVNQSTYRITDFDPLWAVLHVPEKELSKLKVGLAATLTADALPGKTFQGTILRTSPIINAGSGTFKVTVEVRDLTGTLKPGMFTRINIVYDKHADTLLVPKDAILAEDIESSIFIIQEKIAEKTDKNNDKNKKNNDKKNSNEKNKKEAGNKNPEKPEKYLVATKRPVQIGYVNTTHVEIMSGVKVGDRVVTTGLGSLKDGSKIKIVK